MLPPSERAVASAVFRVVAVWLGLGVLEVAGAGARLLVVTATEPGDGSGALSSLVRVYRADGGGEAWALYFLLVTAVVLVAEAAAMLWALRPESTADPVLLFLIALAGLVARLVALGADISAPMALAERGAEALASFGIASSVASMVHAILHWAFSAVVLIVLFVRVVRAIPRAQ